MDWLWEYFSSWSRHKIHFGVSCNAIGHLNIIEPPDSPVSLIVDDECLIYRFPHSQRSKAKRGQLNGRFLDPTGLLRALDGLPELETIVLPIPEIYGTEDLSVARFLDKLDPFLSALPSRWRYAIELHNRGYLLPDYFQCLQCHRVAHVIHDAVVFTTDFGLIRDGELLLTVQAVRQAIEEKRALYVYGDQAALANLMEVLNNDLKRLSPIKRSVAA